MLLVLGLLFWAVASPGAQEPDLTPWVLVVPPANTTGDRSLDSVGDTVAETIEIALRQLGDFELRELPKEQIPPEVIAGDEEALAEFAAAQTMDYIVYGSVASADEGFAISASVWDRGAEAVGASESLVADSLFATFDVADELAVTFLSAFSGQRIAFGTLLVENTGWEEGSYWILVDDRQVAVDEGRVENVLIGEREITVVANNGAEPGAVVLRQTVTVTEDGPTPITFAIAEPVEEEAEETQEPEEPAVAEVPEPEAEAEPQIEVSPRPWSRNTRTAEGRRPIYTLGYAYTPILVRPGGDPGSDWLVPLADPDPELALLSALNLRFGAEWPAGLRVELGVNILANPEISDPSDDDSQTEQDIRQTLENGLFETRVGASWLGQVAIGWTTWERDLGPVGFDFAPSVIVGYTLGNQEDYATETTGTVSQGVPIQAGAESDGIDNYQAAILGARVESRAFWRRAWLSLSAGAAYDWLVGTTAKEGDELFIFSDPEFPTGVGKTTIGNGLRFHLGVSFGFSWGGRQ